MHPDLPMPKPILNVSPTTLTMLDKRSKTVIFIFVGGLLIILLSEVFRPRPINWRPSYTSVEKIPFGGFVLYEELSDLLNNTPVEKVSQDPFEFLLDSSYVKNSAYFFLNDNIFLDENQVNLLLKYASEGNTVFISSNSAGYVLADTLKHFTATTYELLEEDLGSQLLNPNLQLDSVPKFRRGVYKTVFEEIDTLQTTALGYFSTGEDRMDELNYVSVEVGEGKFLLHTLPEAFSNYYLLKGNQDYAARVLSYLDVEQVYWDSYLKSGRKVITSNLRFILSQEPLKWSYYLALLGFLLLMLFKGKREQRVIKEIKPLENTSIEFTRTIGDLYFKHKDYNNIITKKITYFMEIVRSRHYLSTDKLDRAFIEKLAMKSGNNLQKTQKLIEYINHLKGKSVHNEADLISLNKITQDFKL
jgi:hypothetical protein